MERPADFSLEPATDRPTVALAGDWTARMLGGAGPGLAEALDGLDNVAIDLTRVRRMDTAGAYAIVRAAGRGFELDKVKARPETLRLLEVVYEAVKVEPETRRGPARESLTVRVGKGVVAFGKDFLDTMGFLGHLLVVLGRSFVWLFTDPRRIRWPALVSTMERAGLDAIPVVAVTTFFIGAVVAFIGASMLRQFGAQVFAVELIGISMMREFNIVITAVLLAGRSASAFAAEIGSMKMNQEIDAMRVMGVDPFEALVLPRFAALVVVIPLLTFVATLSGLVGGIIVAWSTLDLGPAFFLQRIVDSVGPTHFWLALIKAPFMAGVIAGIGCRQGMEVGGDVQSLGRRVTAAVVHAIFAIIVIDAAFALIYMELDV